MPNVKASERRQPLEQFHCVVCGETIPKERVIRKAVTCSEQHANILKNERRRLRDETRCRFCNRPNTPEERALFAAWRKTLPRQGQKPGPKKKLLEAEPAEG